MASDMTSRLMRRAAIRLTAIAITITITAATGCSGGDDSAPSTTAAFIPADAPAGAAQTPFCAGMSAISLQVNTDPPDDLNSYLISEYEALVPVVPAPISSEFLTVLDNLRNEPATTVSSGTSTGTTDPSDGFAEEGYLPDPEPALRLNAYLADHCFGTQSNPGPPPTEPLSEVPTS